MKKQISGIVLALCMMVCFVPAVVLAATPANETADFTDADGGVAAIQLLNSAKTGVEDSTWDNNTKTLTLKGIDFTTTATAAVKLPDGATIILADGTENRITGGDAAVAQTGKENNKAYVYGIYAVGELTIQGETQGTGRLFVNSGKITNSGNAWTYSTALYACGSITLKSGEVTLQGGEVSGITDFVFSYGMQLAENANLSVTGGMLTGIGGVSYAAGDPNNVYKARSAGICSDGGSVSVSGSGRLTAQTVQDMIDDAIISNGLYITNGSLSVTDSAIVSVTAGTDAIRIMYGNLILSGGKISVSSNQRWVLSVEGNELVSSADANIKITGGELECKGGIYMSPDSIAEGKGVLSMNDGKLTATAIYGPNNIDISGGEVTSGSINANDVEIKSGSLTVREPVKLSSGTGELYASHGIYCNNLYVSGGTLDVAWDWGEYTPMVLPVDIYLGYCQPLIRENSGTVTISGGTVILDTGCAGNTVLKVQTLNLAEGITGTGYTNVNGSDTYIQKDDTTPVKFVVNQADYSKVDEAIARVSTLNKDEYKNFSAVQAAIEAVVRGKSSAGQAEVDAMAKAIEDAIAALEYKDADYSKVDEAIARAGALNKDEYKDFSAVQAAMDAVVRGKNITGQAEVDAMAKAIEDAIAALERKPVNNEPKTEPETESEPEDEMEDEPETGNEAPLTGDNSNPILWIEILFISAGAVISTILVSRRKQGDRN